MKAAAAQLDVSETRMASMLQTRLTPRALGVFALVACFGGGIGALAGSVVAAVLMILWNGGLGGHLALAAYIYGGAIGAGHGIVLGSVLAWTLLRHVALWRVITEVACGAAIGTAISVAAFSDPSSTVILVIAPAVGATLAAIRLRLSSATPASPPDLSAAR